MIARRAHPPPIPVHRAFKMTNRMPQPPFGALSSTPAAVVFDCDGLLMDTEACWTVAETELFARRGLPFGVEEKRALIGKSVPDAAAALQTLLKETASPLHLEAELLTAVERALEARSDPMTGAHALLERIPEAIPVCVASNSPTRLLRAAIARGGFARRFEFLISSEEVERPKPHPDIYIEAARRLGVAPSACVAFEDSESGCRAAADAGFVVVGVPYLAGSNLCAHVLADRLDARDLIAAVSEWRVA